jgi:hypothetical protein
MAGCSRSSLASGRRARPGQRRRPSGCESVATLSSQPEHHWHRSRRPRSSGAGEWVWMTGATGVAMILLARCWPCLSPTASPADLEPSRGGRPARPAAHASVSVSAHRRGSVKSATSFGHSGLLARISHANTEREELLRCEQEASRLRTSSSPRCPELGHHSMRWWVDPYPGQTSPDPDITQGLDSIARNARTQTRVIEDLIDVSRIVSASWTCAWRRSTSAR